jgi:hypothetical protein
MKLEWHGMAFSLNDQLVSPIIRGKGTSCLNNGNIESKRNHVWQLSSAIVWPHKLKVGVIWTLAMVNVM